MRQMSIFELETVTDYPDFHKMPTPQIVDIIAAHTGINFIYNVVFGDYIAKVGPVKFSLDVSFYTGGPSQGMRCIIVDYQIKTYGCGKPCDSIAEAVEFFKNHLKEAQ